MFAGYLRALNKKRNRNVVVIVKFLSAAHFMSKKGGDNMAAVINSVLSVGS